MLFNSNNLITFTVYFFHFISPRHTTHLYFNLPIKLNKAFSLVFKYLNGIILYQDISEFSPQSKIINLFVKPIRHSFKLRI